VQDDADGLGHLEALAHMLARLEEAPPSPGRAAGSPRRGRAYLDGDGRLLGESLEERLLAGRK
jgi:hypothetical protein